ncbi:MAG: amidohydrolase/deacetylase family metallohydrolase [Anaerolineae bacterium]
MQYDLVIKGGRVIDPSQGIDMAGDVALAAGRVAAVAADIPITAAWETFGADGCLVIPGLIDMHTHVAWGFDPLSIEADVFAPKLATSTWVDAGSAGAANFAGFRRFLIEPSRTRIIPFLNVSRPGLTAVETVHGSVEHLDADAAYDTVEQNRDLIKGIKVLCSGMRVGANDLTPLRVAREVAEATALPIMCHIGEVPPGLWAILPILRGGDIVTHAYKGRKGCLTIAGNRVRPEAWEARARGIIFDVGHGVGSFAWSVARAALEQGFLPDTISTDLHAASVAKHAFSMPAVMSKFLHLGMGLSDVVRLATERPAQILDMADEIGTLRPGACGDVSILRLEEGEFPLSDTEGVVETMTGRLVPVATVRAGQVMG